jgi:hypothetical protein
MYTRAAASRRTERRQRGLVVHLALYGHFTDTDASAAPDSDQLVDDDDVDDGNDENGDDDVASPVVADGAADAAAAATATTSASVAISGDNVMDVTLPVQFHVAASHLSLTHRPKGAMLGFHASSLPATTTKPMSTTSPLLPRLYIRYSIGGRRTEVTINDTDGLELP